MQFRNPKHTGFPGLIDVELEHPDYGWIPCTISEDEYPDIWAAVSTQAIAPYIPPVVSDEHNTLTPVQFEYMLALTGLDDVWGALEAALKTSDINAYAQIRAERVRPRFVLSVTLALVAQFAPLVAQLDPTADVSEQTIRNAWATALQYGG